MKTLSKEVTGEHRGILRQIDPLGRVVIPKEVRKALGIKNHDTLEILPYENGVFVRKFEPEMEA